MKKFFLYTLIVAGATFIACSDDSDDNYYYYGYKDPGFGIAKPNTKSYTGVTPSDCSGTGCQAIAYVGIINQGFYTGIAVKNGTYDLKIYWPGYTLPAGTVSFAGCTIKDGSTTLTNQTINLNITINADTTCTIQFLDTFPGTTIHSGDTIRAQYYQ